MTVGTIEKRRRTSATAPAKPVAAGRGWLWALVQIALVGGEIFALLFLLAQPAFRPRHVEVVGEVVPAHEFYDYDAKYLDEGSRLLIPAPIDAGVAEEVRSMAVRAFQAVDAAGMARVDFFLERATGRVLLNELNTIPGFTRISMYPKLWEASGLSYPSLIERLVDLAIERFNDKQRSQTAIDTRLLDRGTDE